MASHLPETEHPFSALGALAGGQQAPPIPQVPREQMRDRGSKRWQYSEDVPQPPVGKGVGVQLLHRMVSWRHHQHFGQEVPRDLTARTRLPLPSMTSCSGGRGRGSLTG